MYPLKSDKDAAAAAEPERDACHLNPCSIFASCRVVGDSSRCVCDSGYEGDGFYCREIVTESTTTTTTTTTLTTDCDRCDVDNGECVDGRCRCSRGYVGNGFVCRPLTCADLNCDEKTAFCSTTTTTFPHCRCRRGFTGDGQNCRPLTDDCSVMRDCDPNAQCVYDAGSGRYAICEFLEEQNKIVGSRLPALFRIYVQAEFLYNALRLISIEVHKSNCSYLTL